MSIVGKSLRTFAGLYLIFIISLNWAYRVQLTFADTLDLKKTGLEERKRGKETSDRPQRFDRSIDQSRERSQLSLSISTPQIYSPIFFNRRCMSIHFFSPTSFVGNRGASNLCPRSFCVQVPCRSAESTHSLLNGILTDLLTDSLTGQLIND